MKYTDPDGRWFVVDDAVTGPVDELIVLGIITLYTAIKIYNSDENKAFTDALQESFTENLNNIKERFSKKSNGKDKKVPEPLPEEGTKSGKEGYVPAPDSLPGVPDAKPAKPKTPKQGSKSGKRKRWKDSEGNIYEWDYQHGDIEKYDKRGKHKGSIDPKTGEQTKPPVKGREVEP